MSSPPFTPSQPHAANLVESLPEQEQLLSCDSDDDDVEVLVGHSDDEQDSSESESDSETNSSYSFSSSSSSYSSRLSWSRAVIGLVLVLVVALVVLNLADPASMSAHLPRELFVLRSAFSLFSVPDSLKSSASAFLPKTTSTDSVTSAATGVASLDEYDPFYRIAPATSNYTAHVCLLGFGGRWGNHVYMMNNALYFALHHNLTLHLPHSDDEPVMQHMHRFTTPCPDNIHEVHRNDAWWDRERNAYWDVDPRTAPGNELNTVFKVTLGGYMQYPTWAHASHRADLRAYYAPRPDLRQLMDNIKDAILERYCSDSIVVAIHMRAGDFPKADEWNYNSGQAAAIQIPVTWYIRWLTQLAADTATMQNLKQWQDTQCPHTSTALNATSPFTIFLATEDWTNKDAFEAAGHRVISGAKDAITFTPRLGSWVALKDQVGSWWAEWWLLSQFRVLAISHSSFSVTAALQSPFYEARQALFVAPDPVTLTMQPYDPWNKTYEINAFIKDGKQTVFAR